MEKVISVNEKKIVKWGIGPVVFITKEVKRFGWDTRGKVKVSAIEDSGSSKKIVIEESK